MLTTGRKRLLRILNDGVQWQAMAPLQAAMGRDAHEIAGAIGDGHAEYREERRGKRGPMTRLVRISVTGLNALMETTQPADEVQP